MFLIFRCIVIIKLNYHPIEGLRISDNVFHYCRSGLTFLLLLSFSRSITYLIECTNNIRQSISIAEISCVPGSEQTFVVIKGPSSHSIAMAITIIVEVFSRCYLSSWLRFVWLHSSLTSIILSSMTVIRQASPLARQKLLHRNAFIGQHLESKSSCSRSSYCKLGSDRKSFPPLNSKTNSFRVVDSSNDDQGNSRVGWSPSKFQGTSQIGTARQPAINYFSSSFTRLAMAIKFSNFSLKISSPGSVVVLLVSSGDCRSRFRTILSSNSIMMRRLVE